MQSCPAGRPRRCTLAASLLGGILISLVSCAASGPSLPPPNVIAPTPIIASPKPVSPDPSRRPLDGAPPLTDVTAVAVSPAAVPSPDDLDAWVQRLAQQGVTLILLEIGTREHGPDTTRPAGGSDRLRRGVYFRTGWAETVRDVFGELVPAAHRQHLAVFAAVSLRHMNWVDPALGWMDRSFDPRLRRVAVSPALDLFHPAFQEYAVGLMTDLTETGIDGIVFRDDPPMGIYDGLSPYALRGFAHDFHVQLDLQRLFTAADSRGSGEPRYRPEFWQWVGWRSRERLRVMDRVVRAMQLKSPRADCAVEVHAEAVTDPVGALAMYGEDVLEAKRRCRYVVLTAEPESPNGLTRLASVMEQMATLLGSPQRMWLAVTPHQSGRSRRTTADIDGLGIPLGVGRIYLNAVPGVP